jgi:peptidoglycan/xylan/chitin deacetylase (PgdA/CDA1 family)
MTARPSLRHALKKAARRAVAEVSWATGAAALRRRMGSRIRAITYHRFGDAPGDDWCIEPRVFAAQVAWLAERRLAVSLDDVVAYVAGRRTLPQDGVLVTIDDGCRSTVTHALPILRDAGVPAVAFVSAGLVGAGAVASDHDEPYATWDELARCREAGIEIGSHAFDHRSLGRMSLAEARDQAERSRAVIAERLGAPVRSFAYPFGMRADFDAATDRVLGEVGYAISFSALHGAIRPGVLPVALPRVKIEGGESLRQFALSCRGAMDAWRAIDEISGRLARRRTETRAAWAEDAS